MFSVYQQRKGECIYRVSALYLVSITTPLGYFCKFSDRILRKVHQTLCTTACLRSLPLVLQVLKQIYKKHFQKITIFFTYQCYQNQEIPR